MMNTAWKFNSLCAKLQDWCHDEGLPQESADELLAREDLTVDQELFLREFCLEWESMVS